MLLLMKNLLQEDKKLKCRKVSMLLRDPNQLLLLYILDLKLLSLDYIGILNKIFKKMELKDSLKECSLELLGFLLNHYQECFKVLVNFHKVSSKQLYFSMMVLIQQDLDLQEFLLVNSNTILNTMLNKVKL